MYPGSILIVDDPDIAEVMTFVLEDTGDAPRSALNAATDPTALPVDGFLDIPVRTGAFSERVWSLIPEP